MKRKSSSFDKIASAVFTTVLAAAILTACSGGAASTSTAASAAASASTAASATTSEIEKPEESSKSDSSEPEKPKPSYSKVEIGTVKINRKHYISVTTTTITIGDHSHTEETRTPHYEVEATVTLKNTGNLDRAVNDSNFSMTWDGTALKSKVTCGGMSGDFFTTLKAGKSATYAVTAPITEEQYNDWNNTEHTVVLTGRFDESDSTNDTYVVYQYLTKSDKLSIRK